MLNLWRRKEEWHEVAGYHVGDVRSDNPVWIAPGCTVVGNLITPLVRVNGLLHGMIVAQETVVEAEGQVWGDVYTSRLQIIAGGKVHGWISTLSPEDYHAIREGEVLPGELQRTPEANRDAAGEEALVVQDKEELQALRLLQREAAVALAARAELEHSFDKRLSELTSKAAARNVELSEALERADNELGNLRPRLEEVERELASRDDHVAQQSGELQVARALLEERQQELEALQQTYANQAETLATLRDEKTAVDTTLAETRAELNTLQERQQNLETALQASLQHTAELEESLLRWQELAEYNESQASELEDTVQQKVSVVEQWKRDYHDAKQRLAEQQAARREAEQQLEEVQQALQARESELRAAQATVAKQSKLIQQLKQVTSQRIRLLQQQLAEAEERQS